VQVPGAAYVATITNTSSAAHTFAVEVAPQGFPAEWIMLGGAGRTPTTTVTLPAVGNLGVYIVPLDLEVLPPAGTEYPFTVHATAVEDPALTASDAETFVMPPIPFARVTAQPALVYATPGGEAAFEVALTNVGNVAGDFPLNVTLPLTTWVVSNLQSPTSNLQPPTSNLQFPTSNFQLPISNLQPGEGFTQTIRVSTPAGELNRDYRVTVRTVCGAYRPSTDVTVRLVGPNALAVYRAGQETVACAPGDPILPLVLDYLGATVGDVEAGCAHNSLSTAVRDRLVSAARAVANQLAGYPLVTADDDLRAIADAIAGHVTCADLTADVEMLQAIVADVQAQTCALAHHGVSAAFSPGATYTLVGRPVTYTLTIANRGTLSTTYSLSIDVPDGIRNTQYASSFTIGSGEQVTVPLVVTPTAVGAFTLRADIAAQEAPIVRTQATAAPLDTLSVLHIK